MSSNNSGSFDPTVRSISKTVDGEQKVVIEIDNSIRTVPARDPRRYEIEIVNDIFQDTVGFRDPRDSPSGNVRKGGAIPIKGRYIHDHLTNEGDDYINSIYKNWMFFVAYLNARSENIQNEGQGSFNRSPGTYDNMYTYILILEKLGLVERTILEPVPEDEYDHPVPEEFRKRRFVEVRKSYEDNIREWNNPYRAAYGEHYDELKDPEESKPEPTEPQETDVEEVDEDSQQEEQVSTSIDGPPTGEIDISEFPDKEGLEQLINNWSPELFETAIEDAPIFGTTVDPANFKVDKIIIFGDWANSEVVGGQHPLDIFISIDGNEADSRVGAVTAGYRMQLQQKLIDEDPYPDWFAPHPISGGDSYKVAAAYSVSFSAQLAKAMRSAQTTPTYYNLTEQEFMELKSLS